MTLGKAWVLYEADNDKESKRLISIISPRRVPDWVKKYMEHRYVDLYAAIHEKIAYKKNQKSWPYPALPIEPRYHYVLSCGHQPLFIAAHCHKLILNGGHLFYEYKTLKEVTDDLRPNFSVVKGSIDVTEQIIQEGTE